MVVVNLQSGPTKFFSALCCKGSRLLIQVLVNKTALKGEHLLVGGMPN